MSACRAFRDQLSAHLDGALEPPEQAALEAHLAGCEACREALEGLRRTVARIRSLEPVEPPPWLAERILARVGRRPGRLRLLAARPQLQAAALVLICFTGFLVLRVAGPRRTVPPPVLEPQLPGPPALQEAPPEPKPLRKALPERFAPAPTKPAPAPEPTPPAPEPPPAAAGATPGYDRAIVLGVQQDMARSKATAKKAEAASLAETTAPPKVSFRFEAGGDLVAGVQEALLKSRAVIVSSSGHQVLARVAAQDLPTLRAALKKLGRVVETGPGDLPPTVLVQISW